MFKVIIAATILIASSASAGEIVWRSPTSGTLSVASDSAPPEQPALGIRYEPISVAAGTSISVVPIGDIGGYAFAARNPLPPGLTFDSATGKIAGLAVVAGNYTVTIRVSKDGLSEDLVLSIIIS